MADDLGVQIGFRVGEAITANRETVATFCQRTRRPESTVRRWIATGVPLSRVRRLAADLFVSAEFLLTGRGS